MKAFELNGKQYLLKFDSSNYRKVELYEIKEKIDLHGKQKDILIQELKTIIDQHPNLDISNRILEYVSNYSNDKSDAVTTNDVGRELYKLL